MPICIASILGTNDDLYLDFVVGENTALQQSAVSKPAAQAATQGIEQTRLKSILFDNKWALVTKEGIAPCVLPNGRTIFEIYDKDYGRTFVSNGKPQRPERKPNVEILETSPETLQITVQLFGTPMVERVLGESNVIAAQHQFLIRKLANGKLMQTFNQTELDYDSLMAGIKRYIEKMPEEHIMEKCK